MEKLAHAPECRVETAKGGKQSARTPMVLAASLFVLSIEWADLATGNASCRSSLVLRWLGARRSVFVTWWIDDAHAQQSSV